MGSSIDFKKEWEKARNQLQDFSRDLAKLAKQGEKEVQRLSEQSRMHVDTTALIFQKERLYYLIGKEYSSLKNSTKPSAKLKELLSELKEANKQQRLLMNQKTKVKK
jgi:hypothetical protein